MRGPEPWRVGDELLEHLPGAIDLALLGCDARSSQRGVGGDGDRIAPPRPGGDGEPPGRGFGMGVRLVRFLVAGALELRVAEPQPRECQAGMDRDDVTQPRGGGRRLAALDVDQRQQVIPLQVVWREPHRRLVGGRRGVVERSACTPSRARRQPPATSGSGAIDGLDRCRTTASACLVVSGNAAAALEATACERRAGDASGGNRDDDGGHDTANRVSCRMSPSSRSLQVRGSR